VAPLRCFFLLLYVVDAAYSGTKLLSIADCSTYFIR